MKKKVVIADDNGANLYMLKTLLEGEGFTVSTAENGRDALDKAHADPPDLIVTDILMPVMDGYALCRQWKSDEQLKRIPLLFYTATYTEPKDEKFALSLGADRFILKPQEPDILMKIIEEVLEENFTPKQVATQPLGEEMEYFRQYNEILFKKLEKKMLDVETANRKLKCMEEQYRLSFENVTDIVWTIDADLIVRKISPSLEKMLGYKPQDFIGRPFPDFGNTLMTGSLDRAVAEMGLVLKGETIPVSVYSLVAKDGTIKQGEFSGSPLLRDGQIVGMVSVIRDITRRKQAEQTLSESEEKYRSLFEYLQDAILLTRPDGSILDVNQAACEMFGRSADELRAVGRNGIVDVTDPALHAALNERDKRGGAHAEITMLRANGDKFQADITSTIFLDRNGQQKTSMIIRDISERKRAENALRKSEARFRRYFELPLVGIAITSPKKGWLEGNGRLLDILGYSWEELKDLTWSELTHPEDLDADVEQFNRVLAGEIDSYALDKRFIRKSGEVVWTSLAAGCVRKQDGTVDYFVVLLEDITDRKKSVERMRKSLAATVNAIAVTVERRDPYTAGHQHRVADLARSIATEIGLTSDQIEGVRMAAVIHDIGKISIPAEILSMPRKLTNTEFNLIKTHAESGYDIIKDIEFPWPVARIILEHHERMDGSGYPNGLTGENILMESRILSVADVVEAIASHRPYRPTLGLDVALEEIAKNKGILYDPEVVHACLRLFKEKGYKLSL
jgi:PAS domain S-box-containing protein/putative nucleotidyltransferase with HDIG domain